MSDPSIDPSVWYHADYIQLSQSVGLWITGGLGALFVWRQNSILHQQTEIMKNQKELNELLIHQEKERQDDRIKEWCKNVFRAAGNAGGALQIVANSLRRRYPRDILLIVEAYEELRNESPILELPATYYFLELMEHLESERGKWPAAQAYRSKPTY